MQRNKTTFSLFFSVMVVPTSRFMKFSSVATLPYMKKEFLTSFFNVKLLE